MIQWTSQEVNFPEIDTNLLERWLEEVAKSHNRIVGPLTYIFCSDEKIIEVNRQFLNHDYYTDIITFDYTHGRRVSGDMFISLDTVASNALQVNAPYATELHRVIAHGLLHLCGINDKGPGEREIMEQSENQALEQLNTLRNSLNDQPNPQQ
ncbi:MAG: rRNA maturation RNase YbeY [Firmicutes bacterium]|nr:rRNA maturation RNase YbeY [Bacillota bacterium]MCM1400457.1 rRNA maturation RNase YbeY [Bacteroides sp.]MCM1477428.1 rRNA maturation RNase YbeY [Bacteroides sp.]